MRKNYVKIYINEKIVGILPLETIFYDVIKQEIAKPIKPVKTPSFIEIAYIYNPYIPSTCIIPNTI